MGIYNINNREPFARYSGIDDTKTAQIIQRISNEIVAGNCFAFVGAGVSVRSGLPNWQAFIEHMAKAFGPGGKDGELIKQYIRRNDLISAAEMIKRSNTVREDFNQEAARFFQGGRVESRSPGWQDEQPEPNEAHQFITRIAFQKIVTTNYDDLLNTATKDSGIITHIELTRNYQNFETPKIIRTLNSDDPAIVKLHGTCTEPETMIITRQDYLDAYSGSYLISWLRTNLMRKSFLFVGYSLSDYDIVNLIKEARAALPSNVEFGRHFAIIDESETSDAHRAYLKGCYNVETIVGNIKDSQANTMSQIFACIHGICAVSEARKEAFTTQPPFALKATIENVCESIRRTVGTDYVALYLADDIDKINLFGVCRRAGARKLEYFRDDPSQYYTEMLLPKDDLKSIFLRMRDCNYYYSSDMKQTDLDRFGISDVVGRRMKSVLIMPVASEGKKVGLLVVGSIIKHAFTADHYEAVNIHSRTIAESYKMLLRKLKTVQSAQEGCCYEDALGVLMKSRMLKGLLGSEKMGFLLYAVDYDKGVLNPIYSSEEDGAPKWQKLNSNDEYLACRALKTGATLHFQNRTEALAYMREHPNVKSGLEHFKVVGNLYITPIRSNGYVSTILVCWINSHKDSKHFTKFERAKRIVRILFNNFKDANTQFLQALDDKMTECDNGEAKFWQEALEKLDISRIDDLVQAVLASLVTGTTRLTRVRLWVRLSPSGFGDLEEVWARVGKRHPRESVDPRDAITFKICYSDADPNAVRPGDATRGKYEVESSAEDEDEYTRNTLDRYATDPYARLIDPCSDNMSREDKNAEELEKDPKGSWLTVPLVYRDCGGDRRLRLIGFLSADDHTFAPERNVYEKPSSKVETAAALLAFQRCALDLAAHIIAPLIKAKYFDGPTAKDTSDAGTIKTTTRTKSGKNILGGEVPAES